MGANEALSEKVITLRLMDGDDKGSSVAVSRAVADMSEVMRDMLENEEGETEVPLQTVRLEELKRIVAFCEHYEGKTYEPIRKPLPSCRLAECRVPEWDAKFADALDQQALLRLMIAANYLHVKPLLDLLCAKLASEIKGKSVEELRTHFNLVNDFSPEEEEEIRRENLWAEGEVDTLTGMNP